MTFDELREMFEEWLDDNGYEVIDESSVRAQSISEIAYDFINEIEEEDIESLGGKKRVIDYFMKLSEEFGSYWQPSNEDMEDE